MKKLSILLGLMLSYHVATAATTNAVTMYNGSGWTTPKSYGLKSIGEDANVFTNGQSTWLFGPTGNEDGPQSVVYINGSNATNPFIPNGMFSSLAAFAAYPSVEHAANPEKASQAYVFGLDNQGNVLVSYCNGASCQAPVSLASPMDDVLPDASQGHLWVVSQKTKDASCPVGITVLDQSSNKADFQCLDKDATKIQFMSAVAGSAFVAFNKGDQVQFDRVSANGNVTVLGAVKKPPVSQDDTNDCLVTTAYLNNSPDQAVAVGYCSYTPSMGVNNFSSTVDVGMVMKTTDGGKTWSAVKDAVQTFSNTNTTGGMTALNNVHNGKFLAQVNSNLHYIDLASNNPSWQTLGSKPDFAYSAASADGSVMYDFQGAQACTVDGNALSCHAVATSGCQQLGWFSQLMTNGQFATSCMDENHTGLLTYDPSKDAWSFQAMQLAEDSQFNVEANLGLMDQMSSFDGNTWVNVVA